MGLVKNPLIPAFSASTRDSSVPKADIMMMGMVSLNSCLIVFDTSMPSISGIFQSIMISSIGLLRSILSFNRLKASGPEASDSTLKPKDSKTLRMMVRLSARSSTTSTFKPSI